MQTWEYLEIKQSNENKYGWVFSNAKNIRPGDYINELGKQGWELVMITSHVSAGTTESFYYTFKRPKVQV